MKQETRKGCGGAVFMVRSRTMAPVRACCSDLGWDQPLSLARELLQMQDLGAP